MLKILYNCITDFTGKYCVGESMLFVKKRVDRLFLVTSFTAKYGTFKLSSLIKWGNCYTDKRRIYPLTSLSICRPRNNFIT